MPNTKLNLANIESAVLTADLHTLIGTPANGTYTLALKTGIGGTITKINVITSSGTCDVSLRINGVNVVWPSSATVVAASSTINEKIAASANAFGVGARLDLVVANNSSSANLAVSVTYARTA
jgi:hypothetical protein